MEKPGKVIWLVFTNETDAWQAIDPQKAQAAAFKNKEHRVCGFDALKFQGSTLYLRHIFQPLD